MKAPILINVVSGKGGTGKSLLSAVLARMVAQEGAKVLLVDFDLFMRGLSHFYYLFSKEKRKITKDLAVSDYYELSNDSVEWQEKDFARERFYEVDMLPAVRDIEAKLDYLEIEKETIEKTKRLLSLLQKTDYDYILIDNRAGVDELILETSRICNMTISVSESDAISKTTNDNLLRHISSSNKSKVYTIINKMKFVRSFDDYQKEMERISSDFNIAGQIPFDIDLFEKFGSDRFWDNANSTRYAYALAETWNKLSNREEMKHLINMKRFPITDLWPGGKASPVFLNRLERLSIITSVGLLAGYLMFDFFAYGEFQLKDMFLVYGFALLAVPIVRRFLYWGQRKVY